MKRPTHLQPCPKISCQLCKREKNSVAGTAKSSAVFWPVRMRTGYRKGFRTEFLESVEWGQVLQVVVVQVHVSKVFVRRKSGNILSTRHAVGPQSDEASEVTRPLTVSFFSATSSRVYANSRPVLLGPRTEMPAVRHDRGTAVSIGNNIHFHEGKSVAGNCSGIFQL